MATNLQEKPKKTILYYPTIAIPTGPWLRQALLYWDEIGSIVPEQWAKVNNYPADIDYLVGEGVFRPFRPETFIRPLGFEAERKNLDREFRALVRSAGFRRLRVSGKPKRDKHIRQKDFSQNWGIHNTKVTHQLYGFLEQEGLVRVDQEHPEWYLFEENTAFLYMSLLAKYVADVDAQSTVPGTDLRIYEKLIYNSNSPGKGVACIDVRFRNALPIPRGDVALPDIITFKRKRRDELLNFRQEINRFHKELSEAKDRSHVKDLVTDFSDSTEKRLSELGALLKDSKLDAAAGSFKALFNVKSPESWVKLMGAAGLTLMVAAHPVGWALGGLGVAGGIEVVSHWIDERNKKRAALRQSPFAYLYHAKEEGLL